MIQTREHPQVVVNPFVIYLGAATAAILLQFLVPLPFINERLAHWIGAFMIVINLLLGIPALRQMFTARTSPNPTRPTTSLILKGPYRLSRNPMYIGLTLIYAGLVTIFQVTWGIILLPLVIYLITIWVIRPEEQYLEARFGEPYREYKTKVRRWL